MLNAILDLFLEQVQNEILNDFVIIRTSGLTKEGRTYVNSGYAEPVASMLGYGVRQGSADSHLALTHQGGLASKRSIHQW